jgi:hypothetical protein
MRTISKFEVIMENLLSTLKSLSPEDDGLWTDDGLPRLDIVSGLLGVEVTRENINDVAYGLLRSNVATYKPPKKKPVSPTPLVVQIDDLGVDAQEVISDDELLVRITSLEEKIAQLLVEKNNIDEQLEITHVEASSLRKLLAHEDDNLKLTRGIQVFFAAADQDRREQEERQKAFMESGLGLNDILGYVNPIDARKVP